MMKVFALCYNALLRVNHSSNPNILICHNLTLQSPHSVRRVR